jgi:hypothetical protein
VAAGMPVYLLPAEPSQVARGLQVILRLVGPVMTYLPRPDPQPSKPGSKDTRPRW